MAAPAPTSVEDVEHALARVLEAWPTIRAAWLFGSTARNESGPLSDIDVAILGGAQFTFDERAQLTADLTGAVGKPCDVVVVEQASPVLGREVVDTGRRFLCRDADAADAWEDFAVRRYLGTAHLRKLVYEHVRADFDQVRR